MTRQRAFLIAQAVICTLVAGMLAFSAVSLYRAGVAEQAGGDLFTYIYTREKVAARLLPILPLTFLGLGVTLSGLLLGIRDEEKPVQDPEALRDLTCARVQIPSARMQAERKKQRGLFCGGWLGFIACMAPVAVYILNPAHFDRPLDTEADLFALMRVFAPCTALGIACLAATGVLRGRSMSREAEAAKAQAAAERAAGVKAAPGAVPARGVAQDGGRGVMALRVAVAVLAVALIVLGVLNGGLEDVMTKANAICMECVGLG